ncbi:4-alpha-glucanotransferase [Gilvimarinus sp. F26214L]|uniref:4-alpha-glucanotransferase n=1 Tax=Gilvimarinus sp. DZF01 TaxID=3461371 RepID=UPI0040454861
MADNSHDAALQQLAEAAGLIVHWENYRNEDRQVAPDTLRSILQALGIAADSEEQCRESLHQLHRDNAGQCPGMLITRINRKLPLPPVLQGELEHGAALQVIDGQGREMDAPVRQNGAGVFKLTPPKEPGYYRLRIRDRDLQLAVAPQCCTSIADLTGRQRNWGIAAQLYSLRRSGDGGIGDFSGLRDFAVAMARGGAQAVAVSPVHALFSADCDRFSPYAPSSRLFTNVLHIDPGQTFSDDLINACLHQSETEESQRELEHLELIDWPRAARQKLTLLCCLWEQSHAELMDTDTPLGRAFYDFRVAMGEALELHSVFEALHAHHFSRDPNAWHWRYWEPRYRDHGSTAVREFAADHRHEVLFHSFMQWLADRGLAEAHQACRDAGAGIGLISDLAVGTDSGGSHAWGRKEDMLTGLSVGAPPDMLNHQGQDWGLTSFSPRALRAHSYAPMLEMLRAALRHAGGLRIDHILGLRRLWLIPEGAGPQEGAYLQFPQDELLSLIALESWRHRAIIVGEDLGTIPNNFRQDLADTGLLGMGVLWFEKHNGYFVEPSRWRRNALATTTTHDLPTVAGWWRGRDLHWNDELNRQPEGRNREDLENEREQERRALWAAFEYAGLASGEKPGSQDTEPVIDNALAFVAQTPAPLALAPVEDLLGIEEQPNLPGTIDEHPNWRRRLPYTAAALAQREEVRRRLAILERYRQGDAEGTAQD